MHIGVSMFCTDYTIGPAALAVALEERGFESLWLPEHSHIPVQRGSEWPQGGELPRKYYELLDPFVALGAAAAMTTRLKLATGICLVAQRDAIQTAKQVASLDQLSGGRFLFGIGSGWNADELENHGTAFKSRHAVMRESIEAMRRIWSDDIAEYHGQHIDFGPMKAWPKPLQQPGPPVIVGGEFPHAARRALAYGDGWAPHAERPDYTLLDKLPAFRDMAREAGREIPVTAFTSTTDPESWTAYADAGVTRIVLSIDSDAPDVVLHKLDSWASRNSS